CNSSNANSNHTGNKSTDLPPPKVSPTKIDVDEPPPLPSPTKKPAPDKPPQTSDSP
ncbi:MAG: hypothetical protein JO360_05275, partial [Acidobacteria bacterium]|nr:hypothetical protein [Acidobacteriota bacterium]